MTTISDANDAKKRLLTSKGDQIEALTLALTDKGFVLEVVIKHGSNWAPPKLFCGIPVISCDSL